MAKISMAILALALGLSSVTVVADQSDLSIRVHKHGKFDEEHAHATDGEFDITRYSKIDHAGKIHERRFEGTRDVGGPELIVLSPKEAQSRFYAIEAEVDAKKIKEHPEKCPVFPVKPAVGVKKPTAMWHEAGSRPHGYVPLSSGPVKMDMDDKASHAVQKQSAKSALQIIFGNCSGCTCAAGKDKE